jgi:SanA protein
MIVMKLIKGFFKLFKSKRCWIIIFSLFLAVIGINFYVNKVSNKYIYSNIENIPTCYTALVLGAHVSNSGVPSDVLKDRLNAALELYNQNKISRFLVSGDHGTVEYDEANSMKNYLIERGIDSADVFMDHAGFDTYNSIVRASMIFKIKDVIIVTQDFHLRRALYIARKKGLDAYGYKADMRKYKSIKYLQFREKIANIKAFFEVLFNRKPHFGGDSIPITGDSRLSYD